MDIAQLERRYKTALRPVLRLKDCAYLDKKETVTGKTPFRLRRYSGLWDTGQNQGALSRTLSDGKHPD